MLLYQVRSGSIGINGITAYRGVECEEMLCEECSLERMWNIDFVKDREG